MQNSNGQVLWEAEGDDDREREREHAAMLLRTVTRNEMESKLAKERLEAERPVGTVVWTRHGKGQIAGERPWEGAERGDR